MATPRRMVIEIIEDELVASLRLMNYVVDTLDRHGVPYAITGSHASNVFGEARFTNDIDVVIDLSSRQLLNELLTAFPEGTFCVSEIGGQHAVSHGGQFNIIHEDSSQKADLIIPDKTIWPDQLARRIKIEMPGGTCAESRRVI